MFISEDSCNDLMVLFSRITFYFSFIPIIIGFLKRRFFSRPVSIFYLYLLSDLSIAFLIQLFLWALAKYPDSFIPLIEYFKITDTNFFGILYHLNVVGILGWYFSTVTTNTSISKTINRVSKVLVLAMLINYLFLEGFRAIGVFNPTAAAICGFVFPLVHLWYLYRQDYQLHLARNPYFWFAAGLVFSMLLGFFKTFTGEPMFENAFHLFCLFNLIKDVLIMVSFIFFTIGFLNAHNLEFLEGEQSKS